FSWAATPWSWRSLVNGQRECELPQLGVGQSPRYGRPLGNVHAAPALVTSAARFADTAQENRMGTQDQNPNSQTQQPGTRQPGNPGEDEQSKRRSAKDKDTGNVPRSDDDVMDDEAEGTREDGAGSKSRNS